MQLLLSIPLLLVAAAIPPLTTSQEVRLETTDQASKTVDEAAFYALLENARDWPEAPTTDTAGDESVIVAPLSKIEQDPARWQGRLMMIEGKLEAKMAPQELSRSGWEHVRGLILRMPDNRLAIVYLTHPPELPPVREGSNVLVDRGATVRVVGRFFKLLNQANQAGKPSLYPVFVGRHVLDLDRSTAGSDGPPAGLGIIPLAAAGIAGCIFLLYYRTRRLGRVGATGQITMAEYKQKKRQERELREAHGDATPEPEHDPTPVDLPKNPAAALDKLAGYDDHLSSSDPEKKSHE